MPPVSPRSQCWGSRTARHQHRVQWALTGLSLKDLKDLKDLDGNVKAEDEIQRALPWPDCFDTRSAHVITIDHTYQSAIRAIHDSSLQLEGWQAVYLASWTWTLELSERKGKWRTSGGQVEDKRHRWRGEEQSFQCRGDQLLLWPATGNHHASKQDLRYARVSVHDNSMLEIQCNLVWLFHAINRILCIERVKFERSFVQNDQKMRLYQCKTPPWPQSPAQVSIGVAQAARWL